VSSSTVSSSTVSSSTGNFIAHVIDAEGGTFSREFFTEPQAVVMQI
jgi:hypothetical protein